MDALFAAPLGALLIFLMRVVDVSMATMRMILSVRGYRWRAAWIGFFEIIIWVIAAGHALQHLDSVLHIVGYAAGFGAGNYVGIWLEERFALGLNVVRAVCRITPGTEGVTSGQEAARALRDKGYAVTELIGQGRESRVEVLNTVVKRREVPEVIRTLQRHDADVFVTVEEVRSITGGYLQLAGRKQPVLPKA